MADRPVNTNLDFLNTGTAKNLLAPVNASDAATKNYVDTLVEGLAWKDSVRVASTGSVNLASPGAAMDGVNFATSDRFLAKDQSSAFENGIYIWNGVAVPATRALDASTSAELEQAVTSVEEGTANAGTQWRQTQVNFILGTNNVVWESFAANTPMATETVAGKAEIATTAETNTGTDDARIVTPLKLANYTGFAKKYSVAFGDGAATSYVITHNLNTRDVMVTIHEAASPYDEILCEVEHTSATTVTVKVNTAPAASAYRATVIGG